jgi:PAS domain S-box-containing protein
MVWLNLDIRTLIHLLVVVNLLALVLVGFSRNQEIILSPGREYGAGKLAQAAAWLLLALRGQIPDTASVFIGNSVLFMGFGLEASAFLAAVTPNRRWSGVSLGLTLLGIIQFCLFGTNPVLRVPLASFAAAAIYGPTAWGILLHRPGSRLRLLLGLLFGVSCGALLLRVVASLVAGASFTLMSQNLVQTATFLIIFLLAVSGALGFPLVLKEESDRRLRESEAQFSTLFHSSPVAMMLTRLKDSRILGVNGQFEHWTGYEAAEAIGRTTVDLQLFHDPQEREKARKHLLTHGQIRDLEMMFRRKSGEAGIGLLAASSMMVGGEELVLSSVSVITERKRMEEERERMIADLQRALSDIRTLKGMLPICASCKKIRDDQGYWNQIEQYIQERSEAEFTHGLCPDCAATLFPEVPRQGSPQKADRME